MTSIGDRIIFLREKQELSQKQLASMVQITPATLSRYEHNTREPKGQIIVKLAVALNTSTDFILGHTQDSHCTFKLKEFTAAELRLVKYFRLLNAENKIRINERTAALLDSQKNRRRQ